MTQYKNPPSAIDIIIEIYTNGKMEGIVLVKRGRDPFKGQWALPGGFQDWDETLEQTAMREAKEETGLDIILVKQLLVYSDHHRDPRGPVNGIGYVARASGIPYGADDAAEAAVFPLHALPKPLAFDHDKRIEEYKLSKN